MRLIDADALRKEIHCAYSDDLGIREVIDKQPTVYDVEKVVEQLEKQKEETYNRCVKGMYDAVFKDIIKKISDGGKE